MYSTMRPQHKAQDCGTGASLSLRRQCWASDRCCYEYDSHVSGLWASQGQWVAGACQRLSCKRRLSRTTYLCLQRCGKSVPCPPVRLICIFCACLVPYELVALTHTLTTALILTHTHTYAAIIALMKFYRRLALCCCCFCFLRTFLAIPRWLAASHPQKRQLSLNEQSPLHATSLPSLPTPSPSPSHSKVVGPSLAAGWRCSALLCSALGGP